jgi:outer membrane protein OmpA-like peptidoglycan-associated protein
LQNKIDYNKVIVDDLNDDVINNYSENGMSFDFSFGLRYAFKSLNAGISMTQLAGSNVQLSGNENNLDFDLLRNLNAYVSYNFEVSDNFDLQPLVVFRNAPYIPAQLDFNVFSTWKDLIWLGVGYRNSGSSWLEDENGGAKKDFDLSLENSYLLLSGGVIISKNLQLGYGYEVSNSALYNQSSGTHEISLVYYFKGSKDDNKMIDVITKNQQELNESLTAIEKKVDDNNIKSEEITKQIEEQKKAIDDLDKKIANYKGQPVEVEEEEKEEEVQEITEKQIIQTTSIEKQNVVYFASGSSNLSLDTKKELRQILVYLIQNPNAKVKIIGHADDVGSAEQNMQLSEDRAKAVANYFISNTIKNNRVTTEAKGYTKPIVPNNTSETRSINRRVEIQIIE